MNALILAAGMATRLRPLTDHLPKALLPVAGRPLIHYTLLLLKRYGITDIVINLHHQGKKIADALGDGATLGVRIRYSWEPAILGTGGGIKQAGPLLAGSTFLVINGDILIDLNLDKLVEFHRRRKAAVSMVVRSDPDAATYGVIELDGHDRVRRILGTGGGGGRARAPLHQYMFTGVHLIEPAVIDEIPGPGFSSITDVYIAMLRRNEKLFGYVMKDAWMDLGTPERYREAQRRLAGGELTLSYLKSADRPRPLIGLALLLASLLAGGCATTQTAPSTQFTACHDRVTVAQLLDRRTIRLSDGRIVELIRPQLFLAVPSAGQPDYLALNDELVRYLKQHLEGRTISVDLAGATLALCGEDGIALGTGLVAQGLLYLEQVTGPSETESLKPWLQLEQRARQERLGLWSKGPVGPAPFDRVTRQSRSAFGGEQEFDVITYDGTVIAQGGRRLKLSPEFTAQFRAIVAQSAVVLMPRNPNFWQLCCDTGGSWFRIAHAGRGGAPAATDYMESAELETFFRRIFDDEGRTTPQTTP